MAVRMTGWLQRPSPLLSSVFSRADIGRARREVRRCAALGGLRGQRLEDFVLAVNEIVTNAVQHARGNGRLRLWAVGGEVCCEVTDAGEGIPDEHVEPAGPPATTSPGGRGIWLARRLCDRLTVQTGPRGTTVCLATAVEDERR